MRARKAILLTVGVGLLVGAAPAQEARPPKLSPEQWVRLLGSDSYQQREEATRRLLDLDAALPALEEARGSPDAEIRGRAHLILKALRHRVQKRAVTELLSDVQPGQVEAVIARLANGPAVDDKGWHQLLSLARHLTTRASRIRGAEFRILSPDASQRKVVHHCPPSGCVGQCIVVPRLDHDVASVNHCVLVCAGPAQHIRRVSYSVVIVNGDVPGFTSIRSSLVICRGNIGDITTMDDSILLARGGLGKILCAEDSLFQARTLGRFISSRNNVFLNHKDFLATFAEEDRFFQGGPGSAAADAKAKAGRPASAGR
jgi:hypothetical protein